MWGHCATVWGTPCMWWPPCGMPTGTIDGTWPLGPLCIGIIPLPKPIIPPDPICARRVSS